MPKTPPSLTPYCVRLSSNNKLVGSGFVISGDQPDKLLVLTARHCLFDAKTKQSLKVLSVDFYDSSKQQFVHSASVEQRFYFDLSSGDTYDVAVLIITAPVGVANLPTVRLVSSIIANQIYQFQGFPNGRNGIKPVLIEAKLSIPGDYENELTSIDDRPESNESSAQSNIMGISGSGLTLVRDDQLTLCGIVAQYNQEFNVYTSFNFARINELLDHYGYSQLPLLAAQPIRPELIEPDFIHQNKDLLDQAESLWTNLQPQQALTLLESVHRNVEESALNNQHRDPLLAKVSYLRGLVKSDLDPSSLPYANFIEAYSRHKEFIKYQQRAATAYYDQGDKRLAYQVVSELMSTNLNDPYAWVVLHQLQPQKAVPNHVQASPVFKVGQIMTWVKEKKSVTLAMLSNLFASELESRVLPDNLTRLTIYYWNYVARTALYHSLELHGNTVLGPEKSPVVKADLLLNYAVKLLSIIIERINGTSFERQSTFRLARYDYCCGQYYLTNDPQEEEHLANELYSLYIGHPNSVLPILSTSSEPVKQTIPERLTELLVILLQQKKPNLVLSAVALSPNSTSSDVPFMLGQAYLQLKQLPEMIQAFRRYIAELIEVDQQETTNVLFAVNELRIAKSVTDDLVELATVGKTFSDSYLVDLIVAFCQADNALQRNLAKEKADLVQQCWAELNTALKESLAQIYLMLKDWSVAKALWYKLVDNPEHESQALRLYLISWYHQKQQVRELIVELVHWRLNFTPDQTLLQLELNLYQQLNNYAGVAEVTAMAIHQFPDVVNFWAMRIFALYRLGHMDQLMPLLDNRLLTISLSPFDKWQLARIYLLCDQNEIGKEAFYQVLKQNSLNPALKTAYLDLTTQFEEAYNTPSPEIVEEGMVVRYSTATDRKVLEITPQSARDLPLAKAMLGKGINEPIELPNSARRQSTTYWIDRIFYKYNGQAVLIAAEVEENPDLNPHLYSFKIEPATSGEQLLEQFREIVGPPPVEPQKQIEQAKQLFADQKIGFHELTQGAFSGNPVGTWEYITSDTGNGWPIYPLVVLKSNHQEIELTEESEFVLDFSALLIISQLTTTESICYMGKQFIVSQYLIDYIGNELEEARNQSNTPMSLGYQGEVFRPFIHAPDQKEYRITFWATLQTWVRQNCKADYAWERLGFDWQDKDDADQLFSDQSLYGSSFMDNLLLANKPNRILLTEDLFVFTKLPQGFLTAATTEWFLIRTQREPHYNRYWQQLIRWNIRGLTLTGNQLYRAFADSLSLMVQSSDYQKAKYSFEPRYNPSEGVLKQLIAFLKRLYMASYELSYKRIVTLNLFESVLSNSISLSPNLEPLLMNIIDQQFDSSEPIGQYIKKDLRQALEKINGS